MFDNTVSLLPCFTPIIPALRKQVQRIYYTRCTRYINHQIYIIYLLCLSICLSVCIAMNVKTTEQIGPKCLTQWRFMDSQNFENLSPKNLDSVKFWKSTKHILNLRAFLLIVLRIEIEPQLKVKIVNGCDDLWKRSIKESVHRYINQHEKECWMDKK